MAPPAIAEWTVTILLLLFGTTTLVQAFVIPTAPWKIRCSSEIICWWTSWRTRLPVAISKYLLPYEEPQRGDIIVFRYPVGYPARLS